MKRQSNAYIVELRGRFAAALTEDGRFVRVRNKGYEIGQAVRAVRIERSAQPARRRAQMTALASMAAGFLMLALGGFAGYRAPAGVVSLDVNPSIEYTINYFDRVLEVAAVNEDAVPVLSQIDGDSLRYQSIDTAIEQTIETLRGNGYLLEETENDVVISSSSYSAAHAERLAARLEEQTAKQKDLTVVSISVSKSDVEAAHALGTSAGKLYIVEQLQKSSGDEKEFDTEDWLEKPVREIMRKTQEELALNTPQNGEGKSEKEDRNEPSDGAKTTMDAQPPDATAQPEGQQEQDGESQPQGTPDPQNPKQGSPGGGTKPGSGGSPRG